MKKELIFQQLVKKIGYSEETSRKMFDEWCFEIEQEGEKVTKKLILGKIEEHYQEILDSMYEDEINNLIYGDDF